MPIYDYLCDSCGKGSTALLKRYDEPAPACPHCGKRSLRRQVSRFATVRSGDSDLGGDDFSGDDFGDDAMGGEGDWGEDDY